MIRHQIIFVSGVVGDAQLEQIATQNASYVMVTAHMVQIIASVFCQNAKCKKIGKKSLGLSKQCQAQRAMV